MILHKARRRSSKARRLSAWAASSLKAIVFITTYVGLAPFVHAQESEVWAQRFKDEAPKAWEAHMAHVLPLHGTHLIRQVNSWEKPKRYLCTIKQKPGHILHEWEESDDPPNETTMKRTVRAFTPDYLFFLKKKTKADPWVLADMVLGDQTPWTEENVPEAYFMARQPVEAILLKISGYTLPQLVGHVDFRLKSVSQVDRDGDSLVRVEFDCAHEQKAKPFMPIQSGWVTLDPTRSWCVRGYQVQCQFNNGTSLETLEEFQIKDTPDRRFPVPVRHVFSSPRKLTTGSYANKELSTRQIAEYDLQLSPVPMDDEFRLPAYGLPEPLGLKRPVAWYWWAALAAAGCFLFSLVFQYFVRRGKTSLAK